MHYWRTGLGLIFGRRKNYTIMGKTKTQEWLSRWGPFHLISSHRGKSFYINGLLVETHVTNFAGMMMDMSDWRPIRQKFILTICFTLMFFFSFFILFSFTSSLCISSDLHLCVCRLFPSGVMIAPAAVCLFD
ncbi:hypothetical protein BO79DRAFT_1373 [Aspergillus costaricaensis CBS 115574]|uniref:Uncharacterized protein n=1 Tax=Aspergillus costaricaensis CBS 115574 TaxID=1448317 RepID=A0ACD1IU42_9EURO|nr:hypothetical protein BO79DRAFT_1373 [Aspergillus costaricaensis CBS 115574]RAK94169.1 hypothetical protein BO79DRAFT_1373 [Aspergillus costaricaensis CBS 115574]